MDLNGAVALVTGGNGGLGQRICHALAKQGAHVAVMYAQSRDQAEGVARELASRHQINAAASACDITDGAAVDGLVGEVIRRFGRLDILVNDAAYNKSIPFPDLDNLTMEVWDKIMAVNLTGPMRLTKAVAPVMKAQGRGRIVNISSVAGLVGEVTSRFGRLDILVNDAAYNKAIPFADLDNLTIEVWDKIIAVNLTGPMRLTKAVAPVMKAQGRGRIVNISSVAGLGPTGSSIAYAVSKAGLIHLTRCMAVALAPETLVNCVAPGLLEGTRATANLRPEFIANSAATSLLKKPADKEDCADMVVTMCRTDTMTGQTIAIDSGRYFH